VLSSGATRSAVDGTTRQGAAGVPGEAGATTAVVPLAAGGSTSSFLPSALPFTGAAGMAAMLAAGLGAVSSGALALRAGRRRTAAASRARTSPPADRPGTGRPDGQADSSHVVGSGPTEGATRRTTSSRTVSV
jgi:hypothetical protein